MLNDILTGKASLEAEPAEQDPFRAPGQVKTIACATCGVAIPASAGIGARCRACLQPRVAQPPPQQPLPGTPFDPARIAEYTRDAERTKGRNEIVGGLVLIVVGILITSMTYDHASRAGGTYIVAYGPIIVGVINLFRGLTRAG